MDIKRGFNRLYLVLAALWTVYFLVVYPYQKKIKAFEQYQKEQQICRESPGPFGLNSCLAVMKGNYEGRLDFNSKFWWLLLLFVLVSVPAVYGCCRGAATVVVWVVKGFRRRSQKTSTPAQNEAGSVRSPSQKQ